MKMIKSKKTDFIIFCISLVLFFLFLTLQIMSKFFVLNVTPSVPLGIYILKDFDGKVEKGDLVVYEIEKKYKNMTSIKGTKFKSLKPVAATHKDKYEVIGNRIYVNNEDYGKFFPRIPVFRGEIKEDEVLTLSKKEGTFDGRYYGPIKKKIIKKARLIYEFKI